MVPDVWEKLPHFQDSNAEDLVLDTHTMKFTFEMTDEDYHSSEHQDLDEIWLDDEESMVSEPEVSQWPGMQLDGTPLRTSPVKMGITPQNFRIICYSSL